MRQSYRTSETDDEILSVAEEIVEVILESGVTFQKADDALSAAQEMLLRECRPVSAD